MSREIKFRAWHHGGGDPRVKGEMRYSEPFQSIFWRSVESESLSVEVMQFIGLQDKNGKDIYLHDIMEFDNGDRFEVDTEDWLEFFVMWIGEPECEDQARDPYRISRAEIIGNRFESPSLLSDTGEK